MKQIPSGVDCYECGAELILHTKADQREAEANDAAWWAWEGDEAICPECGNRGVVCVSGEGDGWIDQEVTR